MRLVNLAFRPPSLAIQQVYIDLENRATPSDVSAFAGAIFDRQVEWREGGMFKGIGNAAWRYFSRPSMPCLSITCSTCP
jgi:hypothetical protein